MSVLRVDHQKNYVVISKEALEDQKLSFKAKGLWAYCMSRPNDWEFHVSHLSKVSQDGEDSIYSAIKELVKEGYCDKVQGKEKGRYTSVDYEVREIKIILPQPEKQDTEKQRTENPALLSNEDNQIKNKNNPPPSSQREPLPPLQKDDWRKRISSNWLDNEFEYAWRKLEKNKGRVVKIQGYLEVCMQEFRNANGFSVSQDNRINRHREICKPFDGKKINGDFVSVKDDRIEFSGGNFFRAVLYDLSDTEWNEQTKIWFKNGNTTG